MRTRRIAILVDGGFFLKRLKNWPSVDRNDPEKVAEVVRWMCKRHVQRLVGEISDAKHSRWLDHVYRLFYYDAQPFSGQPHHPFLNKQVNFSNSDEAKFRLALFDQIRRKRKFALRLGQLKKDGYWLPHERHLKNLLKIWHHAETLIDVLDGKHAVSDEEKAPILASLKVWSELKEDEIKLPIRQKGVDMKIGLDIATMTLKKQIDTIVLVTGDSDFIPAAKVARREGVEFILDPMWQSVEPELMEHIDGLQSGFDRPDQDVEVPIGPEKT